jgi:hypothetical protein
LCVRFVWLCRGAIGWLDAPGDGTDIRSELAPTLAGAPRQLAMISRNGKIFIDASFSLVGNLYRVAYTIVSTS